MIEDTSLQVQKVADTYFKNEEARSRFLEDMQYNMKKAAGIPDYISNEEIAEERNAQVDEDVYSGTEKGLIAIDTNDPQVIESMASNMDTFARLEKSSPKTAIIESYTDYELAEKMQTNDVFLMNAINTDLNYPVYTTKTNIFNSVLLDNMESDEASIFSQVKRVATPVALSVGFEAMKSPVGTFLAHGTSAAYDVARLGTSIHNVQKYYKDWFYRIIGNDNLNAEETLEESKTLFKHLRKNVPEEYRYEVYKGIYERPDPFADVGQSFSGATLEAGWKALKGSVRASSATAGALLGGAKDIATTGVVKKLVEGTKKTSKEMLNKVKGSSANEGVQQIEFNDELIKKIEAQQSNKVDEETVEAVVNYKTHEKASEETTPEKEEVVKGLIKDKEIDNNLLMNSNDDHISYEPTGWQGSYGQTLSDFGKFDSLGLKRIKALGEINESGKDLGYATVIRHGKGVDGRQPLTLEEARNVVKKLTGHNGSSDVKFLLNDSEKPDYVAISTASKVSWGPEEVPAKAKHLPRTGEGTEMYGSGVYASLVEDQEASRGRYYELFKKNLKEEYTDKFDEDNPSYFWWQNYNSRLTDAEKDIVDTIKTYTPEVLETHDLSTNYSGLKLDDMLTASDKKLDEALNKNKENLEKAIKDFRVNSFYEFNANDFINNLVERNMLEDIKEYRKTNPLPEPKLYTHSIKNPDKYPEKYLRFNNTLNNKRVGRIEPELLSYPLVGVRREIENEQSEWINLVFQKALDKANKDYWYATTTFKQDLIQDKIDMYENALKGKDYDIDVWYDALNDAGEDYRTIGIDGLLHSKTNIVIFNEEAIRPVNKIETKLDSDEYTQTGYDNAHMIISDDNIVSEDGVNFFVDEWHMPEGSKPVIAKNYKYIDKP